MESFLATLRSSVATIKEDFVCESMDKYMPLDVARLRAGLWLHVMKPINQAAEHYAPGEKDTDKMYAAVPPEIQRCVDIVIKDPPPPVGFGRNPLEVVQRMLATVDPTYQLPPKSDVAELWETTHFPQGLPQA